MAPLDIEGIAKSTKEKQAVSPVAMYKKTLLSFAMECLPIECCKSFIRMVEETSIEELVRLGWFEKLCQIAPETPPDFLEDNMHAGWFTMSLDAQEATMIGFDYEFEVDPMFYHGIRQRISDHVRQQLGELIAVNPTLSHGLGRHGGRMLLHTAVQQELQRIGIMPPSFASVVAFSDREADEIAELFGQSQEIVDRIEQEFLEAN